MRVILYNNKSDNNVVNKQIVRIKNMSNVIIKENTSIINPVFIIKNVVNQKIIKSNYLFSNDFNRYYYINNIVAINGGMFELHCSVDVLFTYKNEIKRLTTLIDRQENVFNNYIVDNELPLRCERELDVKRIGTISPNISYVLTVI